MHLFTSAHMHFFYELLLFDIFLNTLKKKKFVGRRLWDVEMLFFYLMVKLSVKQPQMAGTDFYRSSS